MPEFHLYCQIHLTAIILNIIEYDGSRVDTSWQMIILFPSILVMATYFKHLCQNMDLHLLQEGMNLCHFEN